MLTVWSVPASRLQSGNILRFLTDARRSEHAVEVRLFRADTVFSSSTPVGTRRWQPSSDPAKTAQEISNYIDENGSAEATIIATDELNAPVLHSAAHAPESRRKPETRRHTDRPTARWRRPRPDLIIAGVKGSGATIPARKNPVPGEPQTRKRDYANCRGSCSGVGRSNCLGANFNRPART